MKQKDTPQAQNLELQLEEFNLIKLIRELEWGTLFVTVKKGKPVMATNIRKDIKLDEMI